MPTTTSSPSDSTTSDNGRNIRAELYAESYFYLDPSKVTQNQTAAQKFGVLDENIFRTTSVLNYTGKVFNICKGQILVQPSSSDATKVNLILKPFSQPIKGLAIKYFIYRGLKKSDFFSGGKVVANSETATGFVQEIWKDFLHFNPGQTNFPQEFIGYPPEVGSEQQLGDLIDDYFFKISKIVEVDETTTEEKKFAYELPMIPEGIYLGNAVETLGIDIVLNEGDYTVENDPNPFKLDLAFARVGEYQLETAGYTGIQKKLIQESAMQFMDIAAFYGLHTYGNGKVYLLKTEILDSSETIYALLNKFVTKNTTYLYVQSNRQRSYNFYGNYKISDSNSNDIRIALNGGQYAEEKFGASWSVKAFQNVSKLSFKLTTDYNSGAGLYIKQGVIDTLVTQHEDYFIRNNNLLNDNNDPENEDIVFTKAIGFVTNKVETKAVSTIIQMIYEGKQISVTQDTPEESAVYYMKDIDDVFGLINAEPHIQSKSANELHYIVDQNLLLINFNNKARGQDIATVTSKRTEDLVVKEGAENLKRITYETLLNSIRQNTGSFFESRSAYQDNSNSGTISYSQSLNNFYRPEKPYYLQTEVFTGSDGNTITGLSLHLQDVSLPSKKLLGITEPENTIFKELIGTKILNNPKFYFKNELEDEESYYTSSEGTAYRKYSLCVIGEDQNGELKFFEPTTKVFVTTIDNMLFASEEYSMWMPKMTTGNNCLIEKLIF
ncbi:hypothetical protein [Kaistella yonginensis]|uniref:hypothetical protein n=1 Tax=Kaistella yonginensis TaxID=658267 RepID=UPI0025B60649|nr:hypothetical protein [Kaistella yonginensis]MDN3606407.1 hypothetical protein [Kaistella yonginensis]